MKGKYKAEKVNETCVKKVEENSTTEGFSCILCNWSA